MHHAAIDGVSGNDIARLADGHLAGGRATSASQTRGAPKTSLERRSSWHAALRRWPTNPVRAARVSAGIVRSLPALVSSPARPWLPLIDRFSSRRDRGVVLSAPPLIAPATPFNKDIGPHRRWAFASVALADVKSIKNAAGVTVNDVVMALCAGALRALAAETRCSAGGDHSWPPSRCRFARKNRKAPTATASRPIIASLPDAI